MCTSAHLHSRSQVAALKIGLELQWQHALWGTIGQPVIPPPRAPCAPSPVAPISPSSIPQPIQ